MISIEIYVHNDEKLEIVQYDLLAWSIWPYEIAWLVFGTVRETVRMAIHGFYIRTSLTWAKESFVPKGCFDIPIKHRIEKSTRFSPCRTVTRYEDPLDYQQAIKHGSTENLICSGRAEFRSKSDR